MTVASAFKSGIGCGAYRNTGSFGSPTFTFVPLIQSVAPAMPWDWHDASTRESAVKLWGKSQMDLSYQIVMRTDDADAAWIAFMAAHYGRTTKLDLLILNGLIATEGVQGIRAEFLVSMDGEPQDAGGPVMSTFTLKPTVTPNGYPRSVILGTGSTPAYSAIAV